MSMMSPSSPTLTLSVLFLSLAVYLRRRYRRVNLPTPPGPPGLPILGNALTDLTSTPWKLYNAWAKEYNSDVIHLNMAGTSLVILDSYEACVELLDRRSGLYSSRPQMMMFELMGWPKWDFAIMPYGSRWRTHRRLIQQTVNEEAAKGFRSYQARMTHDMLRNVAKTPKDFGNHFLLMSAQVILLSIYGLDVDSVEHPYITMAEEMLKIASDAGTVGKYFVEAFPVMQYIPSWFPGAKFQRKAESWRKLSDRYVDFMTSEAEHRIDAGTANHSFTSHHIGEIESEKGTPEYQERRDIVGNVASLMYMAAVDTTHGTLMYFMLTMMQHPEVQRKAQAELDHILQPGQLPSFEDMDELTFPYVTAVVKETLRCSAVAPLLVAHFIESEDEYKGYRIPANSIVLGNGWAILHDEKEYPEPEKFMPERFLNADGSLNQNVRDPASIAFGFGRRICPGRYFASSALWISIASLLRSFDISHPVNDRGQPISLDVEHQLGFVCYPKSFKCGIEPRKSQRELFEALDQEHALGGI